MNTLNLHNLSAQEIQTALETYMWEARLQRVEEYKEQDEQTSSFGFSYGKVCAVPKIKIADTDYELSIQASENHYCSPRENLQEVYDEVEIGFPNFIFSEGFINQYAEEPESPKDTVVLPCSYGRTCSGNLSTIEYWYLRRVVMFNFKEFEFCNVYYNPYEDIEIIQGTVDHIGIDVYCNGQHIFECLTIKEVDQFLKKIGVSFEVKN